MTGLPLFELLVGSIPLVLLVMLGYYAYEKHKNPAQAAKLSADVQTLKTHLEAWVAEIKGIFGQHAATVAAAVQAAPAPVPAPVPATSAPAAPAPVAAAPSPIVYVQTALGTAAVATAPAKGLVLSEGVTPAAQMTAQQRDTQAFAIGPGITEDLAHIAQTTGDADVMRYASDIIYRQVDHPEESITASIAFVKAARTGNSGTGPAMALPTSGPVADAAAIANGLPPVEKARYFESHPELGPYANTLFPNPNDLNNYLGLGSVSSATWDASAGRYRMPDGRLLGDVPPAELGLV